MLFSEEGLKYPWLPNEAVSTKEMVEAGTCVNSGVRCVRSCCIDLLYGINRSLFGASRICVAAFHTFAVTRGVLSSEGSVSNLVCTVVVVSG